MITVTKDEADNIIKNAKLQFLKEVINSIELSKIGNAISNNIDECINKLNIFESLKLYETGDFEPEEYFNILSTDDISNLYNVVNNKNTYV